MKEKKKLILIITGLLVVLLLLVVFVRSVFFAEAGRGTSPWTTGGVVMEETTTDPASQIEAGQGPATFTLYEQDPVTLTGTAQLSSDQAYFYEPEKGDIASVNVRDGQFVKKDDLLYTYELEATETQYELEDLKREQTRSYNQREVLLKQLSDYTGLSYNYQGDRLASYWEASGKQGYYIEEEIGNYSLAAGEATAYTSGDPTVEGLKDQIRQLNEAIEDLEIKLSRLQNKQQGRVLAKQAGRVILNEAGENQAEPAFIRIVSEEVVVSASASEYEFYTLAKGRPVTLYVNAEDRQVAGEITHFDQVPTDSLQEEAASAEYTVTITPSEAIQPGYSVKIGIQLPGVVIPVEAILEEAGQTYVFVSHEGVAEKRAVTIERQGAQRVVLKELSAGDIIFLNPQDLTDGQAVPGDLSDDTETDDGGA